MVLSEYRLSQSETLFKRWAGPLVMKLAPDQTVCSRPDPIQSRLIMTMKHELIST